MNIEYLLPGYLYAPIFLYGTIILTIIAGQQAGYTSQEIIRGKNNFHVAAFIAFILAIWLGFRPIESQFGDTVNYARTFLQIQNGDIPISLENNKEFLWSYLMTYFAEHSNVNIFFFIISMGYFGFTLWACKRFSPNNPLVALLFIMGAFSFYTYGINGIRNGLACSIVLVAISYLDKKVSHLLFALILSFIAYNFHKSTILPLTMAFISFFMIKSFKWAGVFWLASILFSMILGNTFVEFFTSLGFDDRMEQYTTGEAESGVFSHTGFRWDFLIYSAMPIILGYYIIFKKRIQNSMYVLLLNTYTLSNAFWVLVIRASFSNRFAYLSWFIYPLVLCYPLLELDIWGNKQGTILRQIMYAQIAFTWFMETFYWS